ncbi:MAG: peptidyl-prolyl cis-trans isomerase [Firmicutes bacterium]|jgi:foldase protein PrsA|nr:peptidyl-prolyl cis-trans isomerase [Bacillota bacterium]
MKLFKYLGLGLVTVVLSLGLIGCGAKTDEGAKVVEEGTAVEASASETSEANESKEKDMTVVAKVGDTELYQHQIDSQMDYFKNMITMQYGEDFLKDDSAKAILEQQKASFLKGIIDEEVLYQLSVKSGFETADEDVETEIAKIKENYENDEKFEEALKANNLDLETLKSNIKRGLSLNKVVNDIVKDVTVDANEVKAYYDDNIKSYTEGPGAEMYHILVATEEEAKKVKEEYDNGAKFEDLAAKYGTDGTKDVGGSLGFVTYDYANFDKDFLAGAKTLKEGEVSDPVKTQFGFHIIKVTDIRNEDKVTPFEDVKATIESQLLSIAKESKLNGEIEKFKEDVKVEIMN